MEYLTLENISIVAGFILALIGLWGIISQKNIIRMIIGFSILDTSIHLILVSIGYIKNRTAPILDEGVNKANAAKEITDPLPQALVLTAIVIGVGITALMLVYALKLYKKNHSLEIDKYKSLRW